MLAPRLVLAAVAALVAIPAGATELAPPTWRVAAEKRALQDCKDDIGWTAMEPDVKKMPEIRRLLKDCVRAKLAATPPKPPETE